MNTNKLPDVGDRLRIWREKRGLSLRALAETCNVSPNTISLIERGLSSPCVNTLQCLATGLGIPITAFFETEGTPTRLVLTRPHERARTRCPGMTMEHLGSGLPNQALMSFLITLEPGAGADTQPVVHLGEEWIYCLEGAIVYEVEGEQFRLESGDSLLFEASLPHRWRNPDPLPASFILILQTEEANDTALEQHLQP